MSETTTIKPFGYRISTYMPNRLDEPGKILFHIYYDNSRGRSEAPYFEYNPDCFVGVNMSHDSYMGHYTPGHPYLLMDEVPHYPQIGKVITFVNRMMKAVNKDASDNFGDPLTYHWSIARFLMRNATQLINFHSTLVPVSDLPPTDYKCYIVHRHLGNYSAWAASESDAREVIAGQMGVNASVNSGSMKALKSWVADGCSLEVENIYVPDKPLPAINQMIKFDNDLIDWRNRNYVHPGGGYNESLDIDIARLDAAIEEEASRLARPI